MKKLNKKGFTLVELLAVIIILALLIVVTMSTALPAMNNAKKSTFVTYTLRAYEASVQMVMSDYMTGNATDIEYTYQSLLAADKSKYDGKFVVTKSGDTVTVKSKTNLIDVSNSLCIEAGKTIDDKLSASMIKTATYSSCKNSDGDAVTAATYADCIKTSGNEAVWSCS